MAKTLIVKIGAAGDVLRTTPLLRVLEGEIIWVTSASAAPLLRGNPRIAQVLEIESIRVPPPGRFDLGFSLDEEPAPVQLATGARSEALVGTYIERGCVKYTASATPWFDMSLVSRLGRQRADVLKLRNHRSYQEFVFEMVGRRFQGEEYLLPQREGASPREPIVLLEERAGDRWPIKRWNNYGRLREWLERRGRRVHVLGQRPSLEEYIADIRSGDLLVCGDTLAMHIGLALRKGVVAIFTCTSPYEIHDYGRLVRVVSPVLERYFYSRTYCEEGVDAVSLEQVQAAVLTAEAVRSAEAGGEEQQKVGAAS